MSERARRYREGDELHAMARTPVEWSTWATALGERSFRGVQVFRWLHARGVRDPAAMTDLPRTLREQLAAQALGPVLEVENAHRASDGTTKLVLRLRDGLAIETVLIPGVTRNASAAPCEDADVAAADGDEDEEEEDSVSAPAVRVTQCISTQVGCAMACGFCASGAPGLRRHLQPEEIAAQVLLGRARLQPGERLSNVVLMGMGEPLHNYDATARAVRLISHPDGMDLSTRRITISTVGLVPEIERLGREFEGRVGLALSLHAADDATRERLVPINKRYPLKTLVQALRSYPLPRRRRITIEYALVDGINDAPSQARKLAQLLRGLPVKINLIPLNPVAHLDWRPPPVERVLAFQQELLSRNYTCLLRRRRGDDISAACGQLAGRSCAT